MGDPPGSERRQRPVGRCRAVSADDSHCDRCHTVGELRDALKDSPDDRPLSIDHNDAELENVSVHDDRGCSTNVG